jgi:O-antigen/teichoic acid export membrane protein
MIWTVIERFSVQGIQFVLMIVMTRLLTPENYGVVGMISIFLAIAYSLLEGGFGTALVRKQDRTEIDNSTVFYFNFFVSIFLYLVLYIAAPFIADFYNVPILKAVLRVLGLTLIINGLGIVPRTNLYANVDFKSLSKISISSTILSGLCGMYLAYEGWGVWALVGQQIISAIIGFVFLFMISRWRPLWVFSWKSFRELFGFGSKLLFSILVNQVYDNIYGLVIGKAFSAESLGYYSRADHFAQYPSSNVTNMASNVTYPILCSLQNNNERLAQVYRKFIRLFAYLIFPLMAGLAAVSYPVIQVLLGDKWIYSAVLLQIRCIVLILYPIHALNLNLLLVKGRSDLFLRLEIIKKIVGITILYISVPFGLEALCFSGVISSIICLIINTYYTGILIKVGLFRQLQDILHIFLLSLCMFVLVLFVVSLFENSMLQLIFGVIVGGTFYLLMSKMFHFVELQDFIELILNKK